MSPHTDARRHFRVHVQSPQIQLPSYKSRLPPIRRHIPATSLLHMVLSSAQRKQQVLRLLWSLVLNRKIACAVDPKLLREIHTEEPTKFFVFFSDGQHVIQVSLDGAVQFRVSDGQKIGSFMTMPDVNACAISRDGRWFVAAHDDRATMWDTTTQNKVCEHKQDLRVYSRRYSALFLSVISRLNVCTVTEGHKHHTSQRWIPRRIHRGQLSVTVRGRSCC